MRELMPAEVQAVEVVETELPASEFPVCPSCGQEIPGERFELHLDGLDGARPECPRQDLVEFAQRARGGQRTTWWGRTW